jgi:hypothetical protein
MSSRQAGNPVTTGIRPTPFGISLAIFESMLGRWRIKIRAQGVSRAAAVVLAVSLTTLP